MSSLLITKTDTNSDRDKIQYSLLSVKRYIILQITQDRLKSLQGGLTPRRFDMSTGERVKSVTYEPFKLRGKTY